MTTRRPETDDRSAWDLGESLRSLPRQTAGDGFTARVLARLDGEPESPRRESGWRPGALGGLLLAGLATAALALTLGPALFGPERVDETPPRIAEVASPVAPAPRVEPPAPAPPETVTPTPTGPPSASPASSVPVAAPPIAVPPVAAPRVEVPPSVSAQAPVRIAAAETSRASRRRAELAAARSALEALRRDHRRLSADLVDLPEIGADGQPVLYVGGDEGLGLVLGPTRGRGSVRPAAYPGGGASL